MQLLDADGVDVGELDFLAAGVAGVLAFVLTLNHVDEAFERHLLAHVVEHGFERPNHVLLRAHEPVLALLGDALCQPPELLAVAVREGQQSIARHFLVLSVPLLRDYLQPLVNVRELLHYDILVVLV